MFCPKCATQNLEGASYCRSCGANISLVPQALLGQLPQTTKYEEELPRSSGRRRRRYRSEEVSLDQAFKNIFMGIAFVVVAIALAGSIGRFWWYWMLIPAFSMMGTGIAQYIRLRERQKQSGLNMPSPTPSFSERQSSPPPGLSAPRTGELRAPVPSVTEGTTRHLGTEAPTRQIDSEDLQ